MVCVHCWTESLIFLKRFYLFICRKRGREAEKHQSVASNAPNQELHPQPRDVPWLGIKLTTLQFTGRQPGPESLVVSKLTCAALTGVAQWTECQPVNSSVTGWIPSEDTCLSLELVVGQDPSWGCARGNQSMSLSYRCFCPSLPPFPSL